MAFALFDSICERVEDLCRYILIWSFPMLIAGRRVFARSYAVRALAVMGLVVGLAGASSAQMPMPGDEGPADLGVAGNRGASALSVPVPVPPGPGNLAPRLALTASSLNGDGPFGRSFELAGFGEIRRALRYGLPSFDDSAPDADVYALDGELLVYNAEDQRYSTQTETFQRIRRNAAGDFWTVELGDGTTLVYGDTEATRIRRNPTNPSASGNPVFRWLLHTETNAFDQTIEYEWEVTTSASGDFGAAYPKEVRYSANPQRKVEIVYEARPDPSLTFMGGVPRRISKRADAIKVLVGEEEWRRLELSYSGSGEYTTRRSRIAEITLSGYQGGETQPPRKFFFSDIVKDGLLYESAPLDPPDIDLSANGQDQGVRAGDVNGDGLPDFLRAFADENEVLTQEVYLNDGAGAWTLDAAWSAALALDSEYLATAGIRYRVTRSSSGTSVSSASIEAHSNFVRFAQVRDPLTPLTPSPPGSLTDDYAPAPTWAIADIDGDGRVDLVSATILRKPDRFSGVEDADDGRIREVWLNNGAGWTRDPTLSAHVAGLPFFSMMQVDVGGSTNKPTTHDLASVTLELNGDGAPDFAAMNFAAVPGNPGEDATTATYRSDFRPGFGLSGWTPTVEGFRHATDNGGSVGASFLDVNVDGLADLLRKQSGQPAVVLLNMGVGWCDGSASGSRCEGATERFGLPNVPSTYPPPRFADVNADGFPDLIHTDPSAFSFAYLYDPGSEGSVWTVSGLIDGSVSLSNQLLLDADADGDVDQLFFSSAGGGGQLLNEFGLY